MFNPYDFYITPEEFAQAEANGICKDTLIWRIRRQGWSKQRALTEPVKVYDRVSYATEWEKWEGVAKENGVSRGLFRGRVARGWDSKKAATTPKIDRNEHCRRMHELSPRTRRRKFSEDLVKLAESNGVSYATLQCRVTARGWNPHTAATTPIMSRQEIQRKAVQSLRSKYGGDPNRIFFQKSKEVRA
ncbi:hypothetical protein ACINLE_17650 [Bacillus sp. z60-18]|uniref:hypothetical protein n=1 Tax=unclassified Bacillus (in: firmicutes) TaxID=185979 RepID=UPI00390C758D